MPLSEKLHVVVLAGGSGTRFWPLSRRAKPKQLLELTESGSLLRSTFERVRSGVSPERWWMVVGQGYAADCASDVPDMAASKVLAEPVGRNTAPAIGLAAIALRAQDPDAIMAVLPADHFVTKPDVFTAALETAAVAAAEGHIVTLGIEPSQPETGYGYIERDDALDFDGTFRVARFCEKPARAQAEAFVASGKHLWNAGVFVMRADAVLAEMERQLPSISAGLEEIAQHIGKPSYDETLERVYASLEGVSIDYGVMEGAKSVAVVPVSCGWSDVGSFATLDAVWTPDADGNLVQGEAVTIDSRDCTVYSVDGRMVATVGLEGLVVVQTSDATLVMPKDRAQDVRAIVGELEERAWERYL